LDGGSAHYDALTYTGQHGTHDTSVRKVQNQTRSQWDRQEQTQKYLRKFNYVNWLTAGKESSVSIRDADGIQPARSCLAVMILRFVICVYALLILFLCKDSVSYKLRQFYMQD